MARYPFWGYWACHFFNALPRFSNISHVSVPKPGSSILPAMCTCQITDAYGTEQSCQSIPFLWLWQQKSKWQGRDQFHFWHMLNPCCCLVYTDWAIPARQLITNTTSCFQWAWWPCWNWNVVVHLPAMLLNDWMFPSWWCHKPTVPQQLLGSMSVWWIGMLLDQPASSQILLKITTSWTWHNADW